MGRVPAALALAGSLIAIPPALGQPAAESEGDESGERIVYTNDDLPPPLRTSRPSTGRGASKPPAPPSVHVSYDAYRDRNGRGEGWWRHRAADLDARIYHATLEAQKLHVAFLRGREIVDPTLPLRSREATLRVRELEAQREAMPSQLQAAGGLPGWLRRGGQFVPSEPLPSPEPEAPILDDGLVLAWEPVPDAAFYLVEVDCPECCPLPPCEKRTLDVPRPSARFPLQAGVAMRWRVRALDALGFGGKWSSWQVSPDPTSD